MTVAIEPIIARWSDPNRRPLFKGRLIDHNDCCCAQGDILRHECQMSNDTLRAMEQDAADQKIAEVLGISLFHSILLRFINDSQDGCPQDVLIASEKVIGPNAELCLRFGRYIDKMTKWQWNAVLGSVKDISAITRLWDPKGVAPGTAWRETWLSVRIASWKNADMVGIGGTGDEDTIIRNVASCTMVEIQDADTMRQNERAFEFLPMFGFNGPEEVPVV